MNLELRGVFSVLLSMLLLLGLNGNIAPQVEAYTPLPTQVTSVPTKPYHIYSDGAYLFIGSGDGKVWRSADDGVTWTKVLDVLSSDKMVYLLEKDTQGNLYASFNNYKLYRSTNNGDSWTVVYDLTGTPMGIPGYSTTGGFFDLGNGTILSARRNFNSPVVDISNDWGATWSLWKNFSEIFPEYTAADPSKPYIQKMMRHTHIVYYFNGSYYVSSGDYVANHYKSSDGGSTWTVDKMVSFTAVKALSDRVILGRDLGEHVMFLFKDGKYINSYVPAEDVDKVVIFRHISYDSEDDIYYTGVGASNLAKQTVIASIDKGESWLKFLNVTNNVGFKGFLQIVVHKNYLWYILGDRTFKLPKPTQQEILNLVYNDVSTFKAFSNVKSYTSLTQKAYKNAIATISNTSWTNMGANPSFEDGFGDPQADSPNGWYRGGSGFSGSVTHAQETSDVYHGSNAYRLTLSNVNGSLEFYTFDTFNTTAGFYRLSAWYKTNSTWLRGYIKLRIIGTTETPSVGVMMHNNNGTWRKLGLHFYLSGSSTTSRIYFYIGSPSGFPINTTILLDAVTLVKEDGDKLEFQPFFSGTINSTVGSIEINGQTASITSLPMNISLGYVTGKIYANLTSTKIVNISISGVEVTAITNGSLLDYQNEVYLARWYSGFAVSSNTEGKIIIVEDTLSLISGISLSYAKLTFTISAPSQASSTTMVYCLDKGEPTTVQATNGTLTWSYNASTTILTLNIVHSGPANILVDWRIPGDVNGDGDVDGSDLFDLGKAYGSKLGDPNWNLDCDFNWDSKVDASDLFDLSKNYERTKT